MISRWFSPKSTRSIEIVYLLLVSLSTYFLAVSRTDEAHTVWEVLHPAFIPTLFLALSVLTVIMFSQERVTYKLLSVIAISVLIHSFFVIVFPAGSSSGQQMVLGRTRLVYENIVPSELPSSAETITQTIYEFFRGKHFFSAITVVSARMLGLDIFWAHLFLVPVLWGILTPIAAFMTTKALGRDETTCVLASLLVSAFPYATYFGALSVPNSLGFIFFFFSLCFMLRYLSSGDLRTLFLLLTFSFFSFISHYLTGIMSLSLLLLTAAFKSYASEKNHSTATANFSLALSFVAAAGILPLSLICLQFFRVGTNTVFTLERLSQLPINEIVGLLSLGEVIYFSDPVSILLFVTGPAIALLSGIYLLYHSKNSADTHFRVHIFLLFSAFLLVLVDYRILKLFMSELPFNVERLWVFRDLIAVPFVALILYSTVSFIRTSGKAALNRHRSTVSLGQLSGGVTSHGMRVLLITTVLIPVLIGGWITLSLNVAYPKVAPLQTTTYELEAARIIDDSTVEKYVVIGDVWATYAGEVVVGIQNPRAYYFGEYDPRINDLFSRMRRDPSPEVMIEAMNQTGTNTTVAYFIITEPRLGSEEFNNVLLRVNQKSQLTLFYVSDNEKLYVFSYERMNI